MSYTYLKLLLGNVQALQLFEKTKDYTEGREKSGSFFPGDVVEIPFPYTDLSGFKTRPALVLAKSKMDITVAFISTHISWISYEDMYILPAKENGLSKISLLRAGKLFTLTPELVYRKIGTFSNFELQAALWCVKACLSGMVWPEQKTGI
jgi:mRNA interferase MazF